MSRTLRFCWQWAGLLALCYSIPCILFLGFANAGTFAIASLGAAAVCTPLLWDKLGPQRKNARRILVGLWGLALFAMTLLVFVMLYVAYVVVPQPGDTPRTVIVLGAKLRGDKPSQMLERRLIAARGYLLEQPDAVVIVSGGLGKGETHTEAAVMRAWLMESGIDSARIYEEGESTITSENLAFSAEIIRKNGLSTDVLLCTDGFHQLRSAIFAKKNGLEPKALSSDTQPGLVPMYYVREWFALVKAVLFGC